MGDGLIPSGIPVASMTMPFDCHFADAGRGPYGPLCPARA